jgi:hypothetical protein
MWLALEPLPAVKSSKESPSICPFLILSPSEGTGTSSPTVSCKDEALDFRSSSPFNLDLISAEPLHIEDAFHTSERPEEASYAQSVETASEDSIFPNSFAHRHPKVFPRTQWMEVILQFATLPRVRLPTGFMFVVECHHRRRRSCCAYPTSGTELRMCRTAGKAVRGGSSLKKVKGQASKINIEAKRKGENMDLEKRS